ncbi:MAG: TIGR03067 domain-containing protein [Pirellulales bacterium]|nr:TIGR03067 domain-containing protein [Pirellulales bacterium]
MKSSLLVTAALVAVSVAGGVHAQERLALAEREPASLEGIWSVVSMKDGGKTLPDTVKSLRFVFSGKKLIMRMPERVIAETEFTIDPEKSPATIRMTYSGRPTLGIFRIEDDRLTICLSASKNQPPTDFTSEPDSYNQVLIVLRRGDVGPVGNHLYVAGLEGNSLRKLAPLEKEMQDLSTGSPDWSPDGSKIAFDAWRLSRKETYRDANVYLVNADGTGLKHIAVGAMPSWSHDGKRLTFCQYDPNRGVWVMNADGSNPKLIDPDGWGSDWSPTSNEIMYTTYGNGAEICVADPDTGKRRTILSGGKYNIVYWNPGWSADGKHVCFLGRRPDETLEIASVSTEGENKDFRVLMTFSAQSRYKAPVQCLSWDGDAGHILAAMQGPDYKNKLVYLLDPTGKAQPERVSGLDPNQNYLAAAWAPDGKRLVVVRQEE